MASGFTRVVPLHFQMKSRPIGNINCLMLLGQDAAPASINAEERKDRVFRC